MPVRMQRAQGTQVLSAKSRALRNRGDGSGGAFSAPVQPFAPWSINRIYFEKAQIGNVKT